MSERKTIELTRPSTEGGGCYGCRLKRTCSLFRITKQEVVIGHSDFFDDYGDSHQKPKWQLIIMVLAEACLRYEPFEPD